ncbi:MAG: DNA polymerase III subunit delta' [Bacteroidota bacterium]
MKFSDIVGQEPLKQRLKRTVSDNRVSHAQLFLGPEGSGKLALALAYAQYINCRKRTSEDSCGECPSCRKYSKLIHPDLHFLYPINSTKDVASGKVLSKEFIAPWREFVLQNNYYISLPDWYEKIGIEKKQGFINAEDADGINRTLAYKAYEAEYKVMIIWMVEKMNPTAANKLLKNLEEPPDKTLFILISENLEQIIATIQSRAQLIKFPRLLDSEIQQALEIQHQVNQTDALKIARLADGNYTVALMLAGKTGSGSVSLNAELDRFVTFREWMRRCFTIARDLKEYDKLQETIPLLIGDGSREKQKELLAYSLEMFRICLQYHVGNHHLVKLDGEELDFVKKFSAYIHPQNIEKFDEEFNRAIFHIERNANAQIVLTDLSHLIARILKIPAAIQLKKV